MAPLLDQDSTAAHGSPRVCACVRQDPLFVVATEEDQEAADDGALPTINLARRLVDGVRRRKGLRVEEKAVQHATKQRTLAKKK